MTADQQIDVVNIRLVKDRTLYSEKNLRNKEAVIELFGGELREYDREVLAVINLDTSLKPINLNICSMGTIDSSLVSGREVFKSAILSNTSKIILLHNHPSGDPTPSKEDILVTKRIGMCGELLGINLLDHIIIGKEKNTSLFEAGLMPDQSDFADIRERNAGILKHCMPKNRIKH